MNKSDREFLASILEIVSDAIYTGNTSRLDDAIKSLRGRVNPKYPDTPDGATHIDRNDQTDSKWIKKDGADLYFYGPDNLWCVFDIREFDMDLEEL